MVTRTIPNLIRFIRGYPDNMLDGIYRRIGDEAARDTVTVDFAPLKSSNIKELAARFDIVLGVTPQEPDSAGAGRVTE